MTIQSPPALPLAETCCAPLLRQPITPAQAADLARLLKALADPTRLQLVSMVAASDGGEACVCDLTEPLGLTRPGQGSTASPHRAWRGAFSSRQLRSAGAGDLLEDDGAACWRDGPAPPPTRRPARPFPSTQLRRARVLSLRRTA